VMTPKQQFCKKCGGSGLYSRSCRRDRRNHKARPINEGNLEEELNLYKLIVFNSKHSKQDFHEMF
jgi:hypothetical protein